MENHSRWLPQMASSVAYYTSRGNSFSEVRHIPKLGVIIYTFQKLATHNLLIVLGRPLDH